MTTVLASFIFSFFLFFPFRKTKEINWNDIKLDTNGLLGGGSSDGIDGYVYEGVDLEWIRVRLILSVMSLIVLEAWLGYTLEPWLMQDKLKVIKGGWGPGLGFFVELEISETGFERS